MKAKKSLGQNFLVDGNIIKKIIDEVDASDKDLIIEIGPGKGALTKLLKEKKAYLIAYEIDKDLIIELKKLEDFKTKIINQDFLTSDINEDIKDYNYDKLYIIGNLPYYVTTPIIEHIIKQDLIINKITIMVQKEVADRFMAKPKTKEYGYFTLFLRYFFEIQKVCDVKPTSFIPSPKVNSSVINLIPRKIKPILDIDNYSLFLKQAFQQKRKTLKNNLKQYNWNNINEILQKYNLNDNARAEELSEELLIEIFKSI